MFSQFAFSLRWRNIFGMKIAGRLFVFAFTTIIDDSTWKCLMLSKKCENKRTKLYDNFNDQLSSCLGDFWCRILLFQGFNRALHQFFMPSRKRFEARFIYNVLNFFLHNQLEVLCFAYVQEIALFMKIVSREFLISSTLESTKLKINYRWLDGNPLSRSLNSKLNSSRVRVIQHARSTAQKNFQFIHENDKKKSLCLSIFKFRNCQIIVDTKYC